MRRGVGISAAGAGVRVTLIDFTLSRLATLDGGGAYCDLAADPQLFRGPKGDCQARRMTATHACLAPACPGASVFLHMASGVPAHHANTLCPCAAHQPFALESAHAACEDEERC